MVAIADDKDDSAELNTKDADDNILPVSQPTPLAMDGVDHFCTQSPTANREPCRSDSVGGFYPKF